MNHSELIHGAVVLTAPSGAGKTTIARRVLQAFPELSFSTSATTRPPRDYEKDGLHYYFISKEAFRNHIAAGDFIEYEEVYPGRFYGTLLSEIERIDKKGPVLLDIDVYGAQRIKQLLGDSCISIFISPPSMDVLKDRLLSRGTETKQALDERIKKAALEMEFANQYDHIVVNDELEKAVEETLEIIRKFLGIQKRGLTTSNSK